MLPQATHQWTMEEAAHLVRRAAFGGTPKQIAAVHRMGREAAVESLLSPAEPLARFPLPEWATTKVAPAIRSRFDRRREALVGNSDLSPEEQEQARLKQQRDRQRESRQQLVEASQWWFARMMESRAPLREKMVLFWHDHFATSARKVKLPTLVIHQNDLFRRYALGNFKQLTHQVLQDPAMLLYLDVQTS
ncbi:MAG: DUF1800 family protein, partial [Verrucomicrobiales bacterium]